MHVTKLHRKLAVVFLVLAFSSFFSIVGNAAIPSQDDREGISSEDSLTAAIPTQPPQPVPGLLPFGGPTQPPQQGTSGPRIAGAAPSVTVVYLDKWDDHTAGAMAYATDPDSASICVVFAWYKLVSGNLVWIKTEATAYQSRNTWFTQTLTRPSFATNDDLVVYAIAFDGTNFGSWVLCTCSPYPHHEQMTNNVPTLEWNTPVYYVNDHLIGAAVTVHDSDAPTGYATLHVYFEWRVNGEIVEEQSGWADPVKNGQTVTSWLQMPFATGDQVYLAVRVWDEIDLSNYVDSWYTVTNNPPIQAISSIAVSTEGDFLYVVGYSIDSDSPQTPLPAGLSTTVFWWVQHPGGNWNCVQATCHSPLYSAEGYIDTLYRGATTFSFGDFVYVAVVTTDGSNSIYGQTPSIQAWHKRWAVIVGISDYNSISDLNYCDEDASDWYNYLVNVMHYDYIRVLGDTHSSNYPQYDGLATEGNVKSSLSWLTGADGDDTVAFITAGHGNTYNGFSYLDMWDSADGNYGDGKLFDTELEDYVGSWTAANIFIFMDNCRSGGFIPNIQALPNNEHVFMTTTCTSSGSGYDDWWNENGAWTYQFLEDGLINHFASNPITSMEACFTYAQSVYPHSGADEPQEFDGNPSISFIL